MGGNINPLVVITSAAPPPIPYCKLRKLKGLTEFTWKGTKCCWPETEKIQKGRGCETREARPNQSWFSTSIERQWGDLGNRDLGGEIAKYIFCVVHGIFLSTIFTRVGQGINYLAVVLVVRLVFY